jgi:hypothetical protein
MNLRLLCRIAVRRVKLVVAEDLRRYFMMKGAPEMFGAVEPCPD